jgi:hypothetical protein
MHGTNSDLAQAARSSADPRRRRRNPGAIAAAAALVIGIGVAACSGHASPAAPGSTDHSASADGAGHSPAAVPASLSWSAARAPLPADATGVSGQYTQLQGVSCPDVGSCVVVGGDRASGAGGYVYQGLIETLSDGTWTPAAVPDISTETGVAGLSGVSCPAPGACVAVGDAFPAGAPVTPVIETLSGGRWHPVKPPRPDDAATSASALLNGVSCPAPGTCVAAGWYINKSGHLEGYIDTLSGGTWAAATAPLPKDAAPEGYSTTATTALATVACTGVGACVAPGEYRNVHGQTRVLIDTLSGGTWTAAAAPLPGDAAATGQVAGLSVISCPAPGTCVAGGHYTVRGGQFRYLTETLSHGAWTASALPLPAGAAADQKWSQYQTTTISGLGCAPAGSCVATADYLTKANEFAPLIETPSGGTWTAASAPLPADAAPGTGQVNSAYLYTVTCPAAGHCLAVGSYPAADGTFEGMIETTAPDPGLAHFEPVLRAAGSRDDHGT